MATEQDPAAPAGTRLTRRQLLYGTALLGSATALAACQTPSAASGTSGPPPVTTGAGGGTGASTDGSVTIRDQRGKTITLSRPARRIVTIPQPAPSILAAVDGGVDHIVGMQNASYVAMRDGILGAIYPSALGVAHTVADDSFAPNVEAVLALQPDLVVQWGDMGAGLLAPLESAGLPVIGLTYGTLNDIATWLTIFGAALGQPGRAADLNGYLASEQAAVAAEGRARTQPGPSVLYLNRFVGGIKVAGTGTYNDAYISLVGARNPATGPSGVAGKGMVGVDVEQVLAWNPDIVLLGNFDAALPDDLYGSPVWQGLSAVKNKRVYKVPLGGYRWDPPSHESPLMWRWLSMVAFSRTTAYDLRGAVVTAYQRFYGHQPTAAQLDDILRLRVNDGSAGYQQFHAA